VVFLQKKDLDVIIIYMRSLEYNYHIEFHKLIMIIGIMIFQNKKIIYINRIRIHE
jgi:hypothetical protein